MTCKKAQCCLVICAGFGYLADSTLKSDPDNIKCDKSVCIANKCCDKLCESEFSSEFQLCHLKHGTHAESPSA